MPLDAVFLSALRDELSQTVVGAKIDKIFQPERDALVLSLRGKTGSSKLLLSANPNSPRVNLTESSYENPSEPPMFCMLLRKYLTGGRISALTQPPLERMLRFDIECRNEMGDDTVKSLVVELIGRQSNLILLDDEGRIIDCLRRGGGDVSSARPMLSGFFYRLPPAQNKKDPLGVTRQELMELLYGSELPADKWLMESLSALPPLICREIAFRALGACDERLGLLTDTQRLRLVDEVLDFAGLIRSGEKKPVLLIREGKAVDFTYVEITQYGELGQNAVKAGFSQLLEEYYGSRERAERVRQRASTIIKTVTTARDRTARRLANQREELKATYDRERLRQLGDILSANLHNMQRGMARLKTADLYDADEAEIEIKLDPLLSPQQNAAKYYKEYSKAKNAEGYLTRLIESGQQEFEYLESVLEELGKAEGERDLGEIRQELVSTGYIRRSGDGKKKMKQQPTKPMEFVSSEGLRIFVGKNNSQNDQLTLKTAQKYDLWLHTQKIHGSHVVISCVGEQVGDDTLREAALLAAYYSQAKDSSSVPVDYTLVKNVKKPVGAKPGMVIYVNYKTIYVTPSQEEIARITKK